MTNRERVEAVVDEIVNVRRKRFERNKKFVDWLVDFKRELPKRVMPRMSWDEAVEVIRRRTILFPAIKNEKEIAEETARILGFKRED